MFILICIHKHIGVYVCYTHTWLCLNVLFLGFADLKNANSNNNYRQLSYTSCLKHLDRFLVAYWHTSKVSTIGITIICWLKAAIQFSRLWHLFLQLEYSLTIIQIYSCV